MSVFPKTRAAAGYIVGTGPGELAASTAPAATAPGSTSPVSSTPNSATPRPCRLEQAASGTRTRA